MSTNLVFSARSSVSRTRSLSSGSATAGLRSPEGSALTGGPSGGVVGCPEFSGSTVWENDQENCFPEPPVGAVCLLGRHGRAPAIPVRRRSEREMEAKGFVECCEQVGCEDSDEGADSLDRD